ncbi:hypothetical protein [Glutamicibacter sp. NPDC090743]|uniref:hypothetical protein n=1 Tax=Glutamicibacter sp. NPDC090743 TaxID=3364001 RepID=UPI00380F708D
MTKPNTETLLANLTEMTTEEQRDYLATLTSDQITAIITECHRIELEENNGRPNPSWPAQSAVAHWELGNLCKKHLENQE